MSDTRSTEFSATLRRLRSKGGKSRYKLARRHVVNEAYVLRLESGGRQNPSRDIVIKLGLAVEIRTKSDKRELTYSGGL